jgi:hypothetical protein
VGLGLGHIARPQGESFTKHAGVGGVGGGDGGGSGVGGGVGILYPCLHHISLKQLSLDSLQEMSWQSMGAV